MECETAQGPLLSLRGEAVRGTDWLCVSSHLYFPLLLWQESLLPLGTPSSHPALLGRL